jgi:F-type H+/Na+-transporting ATPase subunit alpha
VKEFADDFGYDLDEEGQPLEAGESERITDREAAAPEGAEDGAGPEAEAAEEEPQPAAV